MTRPIAAAALAAALAIPALAAEPEGPSFDCAKASSRAEKTICDVPELAWQDRQMGKAYKVALAAVGKSGEADLKAGQKAFLKKRDACPAGDGIYQCISSAYDSRLAKLAEIVDAADFDAARFTGETGSLALVRYPDARVALSILTFGGGDHTCSFETDSAKVSRSGVVTWSANPDPELYGGKCTLTLTPAGTGLILVSDGEACQYYCGMRATLDGTFERETP